MAQALHRHTFGRPVPEKLTLEHGCKPAWLLSDYASLTWELYDVGEAGNVTVHWDAPLGIHGSLAAYPHLLESAKRVVYGLRTGRFARTRGAQTQYTLALSFFNLISWMLDRRIERFEELQMSHVQEYLAGCARGVHAMLNTRGKLQRAIEQMVLKAGFMPSDTEEVRLEKSLSCFPSRDSNGGIRLNRRELLVQVGGCQHITSDIADVLSKLEVACGFYSEPRQRARAAAALRELQVAPAEDREAANGEEFSSGPMVSADDEDDDPEEARDDDEESHEAGPGRSNDAVPATKGAAQPKGSVRKRNGLVNPQRAKNLLMPLVLLYTHRGALDDHISFHPFNNRGLADVVRTLGLGTVGRTPTVPVKMAITLIERSARWVLDYARPLLALMKWVEAREHEPKRSLLEIVRERSPRLSGPASPFPIVHRGRNAHSDKLAELAEACIALRSGMSLRAALVFLQTACVVLIAAFTARRAAEIRSLKVGCIRHDDAGKPWLNVFIHKTLHDYTLIPVPELVVKAVKVLERLSKSAREVTKTEFLLQFTVPGSGEVRGVNAKGEPIATIRNDLRSFGYFVDVPALKDGTRWTFAPHQFRRFFAVMYIWAYDYGDIDALSYHLRHWNRNQTRRYCTERTVGRAVTVANRERAALILARAGLGELKFAGQPRLLRAAERLCARMARTTHVLTAEKAAPRIQRFLERSRARISAFPWGYCFSSASGEESQSDCNQESCEPKTDRARPDICSSCAKTLRFMPHQKYLSGCVASHQRFANSPHASPLMRAASQRFVEKIVVAEQVV